MPETPITNIHRPEDGPPATEVLEPNSVLPTDSLDGPDVTATTTESTTGPETIEKEQRTAKLLGTTAIDIGGKLASMTRQSRVSLANKRMERAQSRREKMERKETLYEHLGRVATREVEKSRAGNQPRTPTPGWGDASILRDAPAPLTPDQKPQTWTERQMAKRIAKKSWDVQLADARRGQTVKAFGGEATLRGSKMSKLIGLQEKRRVSERFNNGEIDAHERRAAKLHAKANLPAVETVAQRQSREAVRSTGRSLDRTVSQPISSRWRDWRKNNAIKAEKRHADKAARLLEESEE